MIHEMPRTEDLLIIDDDEPFRGRLGRAMEKRGYAVRLAGSFREGLEMAALQPPRYAVVDLRLGDGNGLELVDEMRKVAPTSRMVILTGYGSIPEALHTMRLGADDYLLKSAGADQILEALRGNSQGTTRSAPAPVPSLARLEWEHIQRVLHECGGNVSRTAEVLGIDRRTLQRKLAKLPPES